MTHRAREMALPALLISGSLVLASVQVGCASQVSQADTQPAAHVAPPSSSEAAQATWSPDELNQLVAPIALYPDALVAQIVAAASYPTEVVEADRWIQQHSGLKGEELAKAADPQSWDPSVKAHTVSFGACDDGQEPFLDLGARGGVCKPAAECPRCSSADAGPSAAGWELEKHATGVRDDRRTGDRDSTSGP